VARLKELGTVLRATFANNLAQGAKVSASAWLEGHAPELIADGDKNTYWATSDGVIMAELVIEMTAPQTFNRAMLEEYIAVGQRIEQFALEAADANGEWREVARGTTVGHKRLLRFDEVTAQRVRVRILGSRVSATLSNFSLFYEPPFVTAPKISRDKAGNVTIEGPPGAELRYWINDSPAPSSTSRRYTEPFPLPHGGVVKAVAIPPDGAGYLKAGSLLSEAVFDGGQPQEAAPAEDKKAGWETLKPDPATQTVKRTTDSYPLSDQENKADWKLYEPMTDEFESSFDTSKWIDRNPDWLGRQPALFYPGNVEVRDGKLHLSMKKEEAPEMPRDDAHARGYRDYTSAAVQSKDLVRYGYFEVKARPMNSAGSSSFWFYDSADGWWTEIDVFELGARAKGFERKMNITVHVMNTPVTKDHQQIGGAWEAPFDLAGDYHVYGLEWDEAELKFYFDGMLVRRGKNTDWHQPLTLNFDSETMPEWFGLPEDKDLPSTYSIEYVRVWKKG
jgi:beta-glucanase (GH16 family)